MSGTPPTPTDFGGHRFLCPFCRRRAIGPHDVCGGSFLDTAHPAVVRPVFVPAGEDEDAILAAARERYRDA